jgi:hypothetical protein
MKTITQEKEIVAIVEVFVLLLLIVAIIPHSMADSNNPGVFSINSNPYGSTYGEWSSKWWQWLAQIPSSINPVNDKTGANCAQGQNGPVWFLAGSTGRPAIRDCSMPAGKAILFPALTSECSYAEDSTLKTETQLRSCAVNSVQGGIAQVSVDGMNFQALQTYMVQSPLFNFTFPKDNIFGAPAGPTQSVSDGILLLLQPLPPGNHTVHFTGVVLANPTLGTQSFATDATYHLTIR